MKGQRGNHRRGPNTDPTTANTDHPKSKGQTEVWPKRLPFIQGAVVGRERFEPSTYGLIKHRLRSCSKERGPGLTRPGALRAPCIQPSPKIANIRKIRLRSAVTSASTMKLSISLAAIFAAIALLSGCATQGLVAPELQTFDQSSLPPPDMTLNIPGFGPCTDNPDRSLHLDSQQPVTVLVHGCFGSSGEFRGLAQVLAFHGQQSACFTYNDRDSMMVSSGQLTTALDQLAHQMKNKDVTVIGHSQGALVARKALIAERPDPIRTSDLQLRLVTISGPFSGIAAANQCGNPVTRLLSLGLIAPMCRIVTGDKWSEITYTSGFILQPGALHKQVRDYLKIETDERGTCRQVENGVCTETDDVFSLEEQRNRVIDSDAQSRIVTVKAGHVEIVGDKRVAPVKLIAVLQQNGILNPTEPQRRAGLDLLLAKLYRSVN